MAKDKRNIVVDIGNTLIKSGLFVNDVLSEQKRWSSFEELHSYVNDQKTDQMGFISVKNSEKEISEYFSHYNPIIFTTMSKMPISIDYETIGTLGIDRLMGAVAANFLFPQTNALVIDMGSCITYDLIDSSGTYRGGVISPGVKMRLKAMSHFTSRLPDLSNENYSWDAPYVGKSTKSCMQLGVYQAIIHELDGFIHDYNKDFPGLTVIMTGGDSSDFESKVKQPIFADANLILKGLNQLLD